MEEKLSQSEQKTAPNLTRMEQVELYRHLNSLIVTASFLEKGGGLALAAEKMPDDTATFIRAVRRAEMFVKGLPDVRDL